MSIYVGRVLCSNGEDMIDLNKIIKQVKSGLCSYNSFNIRMKRVAGLKKSAAWWDESGFEDSDAAKEQAVRKSDPVSQPVQPVQPTQEAPPVDITPAVPPVGTIQEVKVPEDVLATMDTWVKSFMEDYPQLGERAISPNFDLYNILTKKPEYQSFLVNMITDMIGVKSVKANEFVETMKSLTEPMVEDIKAENAIADAAEAEKGQIATDVLIKKIKEDRYSVLNLPPEGYEVLNLPLKDRPEDPGIWTKALERFLTLTGLEKVEVEESALQGKQIRRNKLSNAVEEKLGPPKRDNLVDQRMNFFIRYPEYLKPIIAADPQFEAILREELPKMGIAIGTEEDGLTNAIGRAYSKESGDEKKEGLKRRTANIFNQHKAFELYEILMGLIENTHSDPILFEWIKGSMMSKERSKDVLMEKSPEGLTSSNAGEYIATEIEKRMTSELFGDISNKYWKPIVEDVNKIRHSSVGKMVSDSIDTYRKVSAMDTSTPTKAKAVQTAKNKALERYEAAEQINAMSIPIIQHFDDLLGQQGRQLRSDPEVMSYKSGKGKFQVPRSVLADIMMPRKGEESVASDDYDGLIARYSKRLAEGTAEPFLPKWKNLINFKYPVESFKEMGILKAQIKELAKVPPHPDSRTDPIDKIREHLLGSGYATSLIKYSGVLFNEVPSKEVDETGKAKTQIVAAEPDSIARKKENDFIYMTMAQGDDRIKWLQELGSQRPGENFQQAENRSHHELLAIVGGKYPPLLGYLANQKDAQADYMEKVREAKERKEVYQATPEDIEDLNNSAPYNNEGLDAFISLLDHHSDTRNFLRKGKKHNRTDRKHRTNTELYYHLRDMKMPPLVKEVLDLYNEGLNNAPKKYLTPMADPMPAIESKSWYGQFFKGWEKFSPLFRTKEKRQLAVDKTYEAIENHQESANAKMRNLIGNPVKYKGFLRAIPDESTRKNINLTLKNWDKDSTLSDEVYSFMGQPNFVGKRKLLVSDEEKKRKGYSSATSKNKDGSPKWVPGLDEAKANIESLYKSLGEILEQNGKKPPRGSALAVALKMSHAAYKRALIKIAALERMKKVNIKVASIGHIDYIDIEIARVKTEFDRYFNSLFS